jgi:hypothetical protein
LGIVQGWSDGLLLLVVQRHRWQSWTQVGIWLLGCWRVGVCRSVDLFLRASKLCEADRISLAIQDRSNARAECLLGTQDLVGWSGSCVKVVQEAFTIIVEEATGIHRVVVKEIVIIQCS